MVPRSTERLTAVPEPVPLVRIKDLAWLAYLYPARWLSRKLPLRVSYALWDALAWLGARCLQGPRGKLVARLRLAFPADRDQAALERIATGHLERSILRFHDDLLLPRLQRAGALRDVQLVHREHLAGALAAGKGAMLASGHFLASRVARCYLEAIGHPSLSVRNLRPRDAAAGRLGRRFVQQRYVRFLSESIGDEVAVQDPDCSLKMIERLRSGGLIDIHIDAAFSREILRREFLGANYPFGVGCLHLAWLVGAPVVPLMCHGSSRRLKIEFGEPIHPEGCPDRGAFAASALDRILRFLEAELGAAPEEWDLWIRW